MTITIPDICRPRQPWRECKQCRFTFHVVCVCKKIVWIKILYDILYMMEERQRLQLRLNVLRITFMNMDDQDFVWNWQSPQSVAVGGQEGNEARFRESLDADLGSRHGKKYSSSILKMMYYTILHLVIFASGYICNMQSAYFYSPSHANKISYMIYDIANHIIKITFNSNSIV